jgi:pilus assembly protein Flp/PilA
VDRIAFMKNVIMPWVKARINAKSELGASLVEYALLVALIAVVCIVGITFLGRKANEEFDSVGSELG